MKIDQVNIDRLVKHLNKQRALLASLSEGHVKDVVQAEVNAIEFSLKVLDIKESKNY